MEQILLAFGSNLGDRLEALRQGLGSMTAGGELQLLRASSVYETRPVGGPPQGPYLNACALVAGALSPREVLVLIRRAEERGGRLRAGRDHPRSLDVDLVLHGTRRVAEEDLRVPHPRLAGRAFVLVPAVEVAAEMRHPVSGESLAAMLEKLGAVTGVLRAGGPEDWT